MDKRFTYLVEKYLDNDLSATEKAVFEKYLEDPACRKYLEDAKKVEEIMEEGIRKIAEASGRKTVAAAGAAAGRKTGAVKKGFLEDEDDIPEEIKQDVLKYGSIDDPVTRQMVKSMHKQMIRRIRTSQIFRYIVSVPSAASLLIAMYFLWTVHFKPLPQKLYLGQYKPYEFALISPATEPDEKIRSAMTMYKSGNYTESARLCNVIIASGTEEGDVHFLYGLNLMALDSMQRAIQEFDAQTLSLSARDMPVYWYKSLCYLKLGKPGSAIITIIKGYYRKIKKKFG